jgi:hypothetical protein
MTGRGLGRDKICYKAYDEGRGGGGYSLMAAEKKIQQEKELAAKKKREEQKRKEEDLKKQIEAMKNVTDKIPDEETNKK